MGLMVLFSGVLFCVGRDELCVTWGFHGNRKLNQGDSIKGSDSPVSTFTA